MFSVHYKSFRRRELSRLRSLKYRQARRELSCVQQSSPVLDENSANLILHEVELPYQDLLSITNSNCVPNLHSDREQVCDVVPNDEPESDSVIIPDDLEQPQESSFEASIDERLRDSMTSDSENESALNMVMNNSKYDQLRQWALIYPPLTHTRLEQLMDILRDQYPDLPKSAKTFLGTNSLDYKIEKFENGAEFVYFGIEANLIKCINTQFHEINDIELLINVDGAPLFKSSRKQLWPILCQVFHHCNYYKPFIVAIFCGASKPDDVHLYLEKFIQEINILQDTGIIISNCSFNISIKAFVCDRPARSFLKCMKNHGGYYACERCTVSGKRYKRRTVYPLNDDSEIRTNESFRNQTNSDHHTGNSPLLLIEPEIDLVNQFVLDSMHLLFLGVMKKLLDCWIDGNVNKKLKISNNDKTRLSLLLTKIKVTSEFQRSTRSLTDFHKFKATEFQFLLLYAGPIVFRKILPKTIYQHFLLLHSACRILYSNDMAVKKIKYAKHFLQEFVRIAPLIYTLQFIVGNIHSLYHLADDVESMQCNLSLISSYPFENLLGKIKRLLRCGSHPLAQLCRRFSEMDSTLCPKPELSNPIVILREYQGNNDNELLIKRIKFNNFLLTTKSPDHTVLLKNEQILQINKIYRVSTDDNNHIKIDGIILKKKKALFSYPCDANDLQMWNVSAKNGIIGRYKIGDIMKKMVCIDLSDGNKENLCVIPLLHL